MTNHSRDGAKQAPSNKSQKNDSREEGSHRKPVTQLMVQAVRRHMEIMTDDTVVPCLHVGAQTKARAETEESYFGLLSVADFAQLHNCSEEQVHEKIKRLETPVLAIAGSFYVPMTMHSDCLLLQYFCQLDSEAYEMLEEELVAAGEVKGLHFRWTGAASEAQIYLCADFLAFVADQSRMYLCEVTFAWVHQQLARVTTWTTDDGKKIPTPPEVIQRIFIEFGLAPDTLH